VLLPKAVAQQQVARRYCQNQRLLSVGRCHQQAASLVAGLQPPGAQLALQHPGPGPEQESAPRWSIGAR